MRIASSASASLKAKEILVMKIKNLIFYFFILYLLATFSCVQTVLKEIEQKDINTVIQNNTKISEKVKNQIEIYVNDQIITGKTMLMDFDSMPEGRFIIVKCKQKCSTPKQCRSLEKKDAIVSAKIFNKTFIAIPYKFYDKHLSVHPNLSTKKPSLTLLDQDKKKLFDLPDNDEKFHDFSDIQPDYSDIQLIDLIDTLRKVSFISEDLKIELTVKMQDQKEVVNLIFNDHELSKLEPLIADMKAGESTLAPFPDVQFLLKYSKDFILDNGDNDVFLLKIENKGKGDIFKLKAYYSSSFPLFDNKEFLIGHVPKGFIRYVRFPFTIPKNTLTQDIQVRVKFKEANGYEPNDLSQLIYIKGEKPPKFSLEYTIKEDGSGNSIGNGDGIITIRESVDIIIRITNTSDTIAESVKAWIELSEDNIEGLVLNIDHINVGCIKSHKTVQDKFTITVQPSYQLNEINLNLTIEDGVYKSKFKDQIILPLGKIISEKPNTKRIGL